jgi:hypothetical protein
MHAAIANKTGGDIWATQETMARKMGFKNPRTVGRHQATLRQMGYLQLERKQGRNLVYQLSLPLSAATTR